MFIWRYLHFVDNASGAANGTLSSDGAANGTLSSSPPDRLWKVRPVISAVVAACRTNYQPHRENSIDEAMVAFKGRSSMKQYVPKKPVKRGFKVWVRADSHNGYISDFDVYTGKKGDTAEVGLGGSVVKRLTRDLVGKYYHIYMDNFFSSVTLYKNLLEEGIYCTGTLQANRRYFPPDLQACRGLAKRGDMVARQEGNLTVTVWQDKRLVTSVSTAHSPDQTEVVKRKKVDGSIIHVDCPVCIVDYNKYMGGVDKGDQLRQYYYVRVKSRKSYKYIFWFLFEVCVQNAFVFCKHYMQPCIHTKTYLRFRQELARQLIGNYCSRKRKCISRATIHHDLVCSSQHYPVSLGADKRGLCKYPGCHCQTVWYCATCDKRLCHSKKRDCFSKHHAHHNLFQRST